MSSAQRRGVHVFAAIALISMFTSATAAQQYTVDLLPGFIFTSQADAESALHAYSAEASHLTRDRVISETPTEKSVAIQRSTGGGPAGHTGTLWRTARVARRQRRSRD